MPPRPTGQTSYGAAGGIRQRLRVDNGGASNTGASSSSGPQVAGGIKRRAEQGTASASVSGKPLNNVLRRDWLAGELVSERVLEYAAAAAEQGAEGARMGNWEDPK